MTHIFRKIHIALALLLATSSGVAYGDYRDMSPCDAIESCCPCPSSCCGGGFVSLDLIYWRAFQSGIDTCIPTCESETVGSDGRTISNFKGRIRNPHFHWNPGFRLAAGYDLPCSCWDLAASWTHLYSHARGYGVRWNINFDVIDFVAAYDLEYDSCVSIWPFAGIRGARIHQKLHFGDCHSSTPLSSRDLRVARNNKERFYGAGPLLGLEADWNIWCDFSLYARGSIAWLYGNYHLRLKEFDESIDSVNFRSLRKHLDGTIAACDAGLGVRWHTCFCDNMRLILQLGLEHHRYFDYNRFCSYGDLSFDGLNFSVGIEL